MYLQPTWNNSVLGPNFQATSSSTTVDWGDGTTLDSSVNSHSYPLNATGDYEVTVSGTEQGVLTTTQSGLTTSTQVSYTQEVSFTLPLSNSTCWNWQSYAQSAINIPSPAFPNSSITTTPVPTVTPIGLIPSRTSPSTPAASPGVLATVSATTNGQAVTITVSNNQALMSDLPDVVVSWGDGTTDTFDDDTTPISTSSNTSQADDDSNGGAWEYDTGTDSSTWNLSKLHTYAAAGVYQVTISVAASAQDTVAAGSTLQTAFTATVGSGDSSTWLNGYAALPMPVALSAPTSLVTAPIATVSSNSPTTAPPSQVGTPTLSVLTKPSSSTAAPASASLLSSSSQGSSKA